MKLNRKKIKRVLVGMLAWPMLLSFRCVLCTILESNFRCYSLAISSSGTGSDSECHVNNNVVVGVMHALPMIACM